MRFENPFENHISKISFKFPMGQLVKKNDTFYVLKEDQRTQMIEWKYPCIFNPYTDVSNGLHALCDHHLSWDVFVIRRR